MAIRKEQVLLLLTLAFAGWSARSLLAEPPRSPAFQPTKIEYTAATVVPIVLATGAAPAPARSDFFTEPSETRPLAPRVLDFPPRAPLTVAALPLDPGPDHGHMWALAIDGATVEGVSIQTGAGGEAGAGEGTPTPATAAPAEGAQNEGRRDDEQLARTYDRLWIVGQRAPYFGTIEADGKDLFELEERRDFDGVVVRMRVYERSRERVGDLREFGKDAATRIERVVLANTLRNEVQRRVRRVPAEAAHLQERRELIAWLLEQAREADWIHDVALEQARVYGQVSQGDLDALRLEQRVLQARGDLAAEFALLEGLTGEHRESAFRYEALGVLEDRLGLHAEAERHLGQAAGIAPNDPRPHAALADFLRRQGRSADAVAAARSAERTFGTLQSTADRARVVRAIVACHLAVADVEAARTALQLNPAAHPQPYLTGCVQYAAGEIGAALASFRQAAGSADGPAAALGQAACLLREGQWQEAHDLFVGVADQEPLLRHRAATGLALLFCRLGQYDAANAWIDRALEAAPDDAYAYYLRGRLLRLSGQLAAAGEALTAALRRHDDFVHAIAEMATVHAGRAAEGRGSAEAEAAIAAMRYADRAVALVHAPAAQLRELQGLYHFGAGDPRGARTAFQAARDLAATDAGQLFARGGLAVVDYSRGLVEDAVDALRRMSDDLDQDDPMRHWAEGTLSAIDDHAQKELLEDDFARGELGSVWGGDRDGGQWAQIVDGALVFRVQRLANADELNAVREGAVKNGKNFLAVGCTMQLGPGQPSTESGAGLRIEMARGGNGSPELRVEIGIQDGKPQLRIEDGRDGGRQNVVRSNPTVAGFDRSAEQRLELRVVPRGDAQSRALGLQVWWNDQMVATHDLKTLTGNTTSEVRTVLFAAGRKGSGLDVKFDDYRLERRKGTTR